MQILDTIFIAIFAIYIIRGLITGLVSSSISILSKAAALFLAVGLTPYITLFLPFWVFWSILLVFLLLTSLFRIFVLKKNTDKVSLFDRLLGMIIGGLDALFVGGLLTYFLLAYPHASWAEWVESSNIGYFFSTYIYQAQLVIQI